MAGSSGHLLPVGAVAYRHIAGDVAVFPNGGGIGVYPVKIAVLAAILHQPAPGVARLDGSPHVLERFGWHVRVAHDIVRLPYQFVFAEAADVDEGTIGIGDGAAQIRFGDDGTFRGKKTLGLGNG